MGNLKDIKETLTTEAFSKTLSYIYGCKKEETFFYADRLASAAEGFHRLFGPKEDIHIFSAPGRTEIGGNHTDHQRGQVLAASVNLDAVAVVSKNNDAIIRIQSEGYPLLETALDEIRVEKSYYNTTKALVNGVAAGFLDLGYTIGGFDAYITSNVLQGSGLSSSAAFEVLIGTIINGLFCENKETAIKIAQIGQFAENVYFGKPSGLMDQMASSVGGFVAIDFKDTENPIVKKIDFDFALSGYCLCIVDSMGSHADLTPEYTAIPEEMKGVASYFGKEVLSEITKEEFLSRIKDLRTVCSDRAILRAYHFFTDNERVKKQVEALNNNDFESFKKLVIASGYSSYMYLQNVYAAKNPENQCLSIALAVSEELLKDKGAYRVQGGGFAGTIEAFVPLSMVEEFKTKIEAVFGEGTCHILSIRPVGGVQLL